ncbi:MAG: hypothetical protein K2J80_05190, partial [Oscillospiraceae bacterium]|nr:hypothetical protein [Oscillospiraceae bacterium]
CIRARAFWGFIAAFYAVKLWRALKFRKAEKQGQISQCEAEIIETRPQRYNHGVRAAAARYTFEGREYTGNMVWMYDMKISRGQNVSVIVSRLDPELFAVSDKQSKKAIVTCSAVCAVSAVFFVMLAVSLMIKLNK